MKMDRQITRLGRLGDHWDDDFVPGTMAERIAMVWPLTRDVFSLSRRHDVERRLQRHVARLVRRGG
jgi:hypothetical protein